MEIARTLDTNSFIMALRRFISRRGQVKEIRSDNGTNLVGGEKELHLAIKDWNQEQIHNFLVQKEIKWIFNPPTASHYGGIWERCIRTVRKVLKALMKEQIVDEESLTTLFCEVESIVNSRPLTKVSSDSRDLEPLTPNHLLLLRREPAQKTLATNSIFNKYILETVGEGIFTWTAGASEMESSTKKFCCWRHCTGCGSVNSTEFMANRSNCKSLPR